MGALKPIYATENCRFSGPLRWHGSRSIMPMWTYRSIAALRTASTGTTCMLLSCTMNAGPLAILNNLAHVHGMKPVFQFGAFIGTFGEYQQGAVRSDPEISEAPS